MYKYTSQKPFINFSICQRNGPIFIFIFFPNSSLKWLTLWLAFAIMNYHVNDDVLLGTMNNAKYTNVRDMECGTD